MLPMYVGEGDLNAVFGETELCTSSRSEQSQKRLLQFGVYTKPQV